ncbi:MAG: UDP-N-acetylglucosamine--LPS N-acetylglucosamine transferase, partial [Clostridium sp.]|nr:UDP-N-acetylglucosamine--LPS N-acetylglucosamine transferase [Clostridium sp.]
TVTEAISKHLPILIPFAIPGQETQNVEFLTSNGYGIYVDNLLEINLIINDLISNRDKLKTMEKNLYNLSSKYSKDKIVDIANKLISNR